jgi:ABC-type antimicrobial peptide transport system permease subunit
VLLVRAEGDIREIGIRMALGARQADVLRMVMKQGLRLGLTGGALGVAIAMGVPQLLAGALYSPTDPLTYAALTAFLLDVVILASYFPARRAARLDPMIALRYE